MFNQLNLTGETKRKADSFFELGLNYSDYGDDEKALQNFQSAQSLYKDLGDEISLAKTNFRMAEVLFRQDKTAQAVTLLFYSSEVLTEKGLHREVSDRLIKYSEYLKEKKRLDEFSLLSIPLSKALECSGFLAEAQLLLTGSVIFACKLQNRELSGLCLLRLKEIETAILEVEFFFKSSSKIGVA